MPSLFKLRLNLLSELKKLICPLTQVDPLQVLIIVCNQLNNSDTENKE